jgi:hypothetical protein
LNKEHTTIAKACSLLSEDLDLVDLSEVLYKGKTSVEAISSLLCKDLTNACTKKAPPIPKVGGRELRNGGGLDQIRGTCDPPEDHP